MEHSPEERIKELEAELDSVKHQLAEYKRYIYNTKEDIGSTITITFLLFSLGIGCAVALHMGWKVF